MATTTTVPTLRPHAPKLPHVTIPHHLPGTGLVVAVVVVGVVVLWVSASHRQKRRQNLIHAVLRDVAGFLKVDVTLARPTFGRPPVKWDGGQLTYLHCRYGHGPKDTYVNVKAGLPQTLSHRLGGPVALEWNHPKHMLSIKRIRPIAPLPARVDHPTVTVRADRLPWAVAQNGNIVTWNLAQQPHCLVVGATGAGKSSAIRTLVVEAVRAGLEVTICDPKRITFRGFKDWPGVTVATTTQAMGEAINRAHDEQERRYSGIENGTLEPDDLGRYLLIVDELHELIDRLDQTDAFDKIRSIARMGREGGVHLVVGIQRPDSKVIEGSFRDQLALRIALGYLTGQAQQMVGTGAQVSSDAKGRALAVVEGSAVECQSWWTPNPADHLSKNDRAILDALRPPGASKPANTSTNTPANTVANVPANGLPDALADEKIARIRQLRDDGLSIRAVAAECGVSVAAVHKYTTRRPALHVVRDD